MLTQDSSRAIVKSSSRLMKIDGRLRDWGVQS